MNLREEIDRLIIEKAAYELELERIYKRRYEEHLLIMEWLR